MFDILGGLQVAASYIINPITAAYALAAIGLNVHFGYTGLLQLRPGGIHGGGRVRVPPSRSSPSTRRCGSRLLVGALAASAVFAAILGIPTLRLRADYLAIVTIAAAEIVRLLVTSTAFVQWTGGANGLGSVPRRLPLARTRSQRRATLRLRSMAVDRRPSSGSRVFGIILLAIAVVHRLGDHAQPMGRVLKGIREDEDAVRSLGKNVFS